MPGGSSRRNLFDRTWPGCRVHMKRFDEAIADLESSLALKAEQPELRRFLAVTCNNRAWQLLTGPMAQRDPPAALKLAEKALTYRPEEHLYVNTLGVAQYRNGRHIEASITLAKSLALGKDTFAAFDLYFLAMCHAKLGDAAKARAYFIDAERWLE